MVFLFRSTDLVNLPFHIKLKLLLIEVDSCFVNIINIFGHKPAPIEMPGNGNVNVSINEI